MDIITLLLLALGLAMDAFAVSISNGLCYGKSAPRARVAGALAFGAAQGAMPLFGYLAGQAFSSAIERFDHWIALILLSFIGGKMVLEAIQEAREGEQCPAQAFSLKLLGVQAIATSIDALAVGVSFAVMKVNILMAASFIAVITFVCCLVGYGIGQRFGGMLKQKATIFGGVILIGIGLKIFIEHMS